MRWFFVASNTPFAAQMFFLLDKNIVPSFEFQCNCSGVQIRDENMSMQESDKIFSSCRNPDIFFRFLENSENYKQAVRE